MQKFLITIGLLIIVSGIAWPWISALPLGRLPGDIIVERQNFRFYFPITTMLLVSVLVSLIIWIFRQ